MTITTLSKGYQITIPSAIRKALGLQAGDPIEIITKNNHILITKSETQEEAVKRVFAELNSFRKEHAKHMTSEQKTFAQKTKGWTANQTHQYIDSLPETQTHIKEEYGI